MRSIRRPEQPETDWLELKWLEPDPKCTVSLTLIFLFYTTPDPGQIPARSRACSELNQILVRSWPDTDPDPDTDTGTDTGTPHGIKS